MTEFPCPKCQRARHAIEEACGHCGWRPSPIREASPEVAAHWPIHRDPTPLVVAIVLTLITNLVLPLIAFTGALYELLAFWLGAGVGQMAMAVIWAVFGTQRWYWRVLISGAAIVAVYLELVFAILLATGGLPGYFVPLAGHAFLLPIGFFAGVATLWAMARVLGLRMMHFTLPADRDDGGQFSVMDLLGVMTLFGTTLATTRVGMVSLPGGSVTWAVPISFAVAGAGLSLAVALPCFLGGMVCREPTWGSAMVGIYGIVLLAAASAFRLTSGGARIPLRWETTSFALLAGALGIPLIGLALLRVWGFRLQ